VRIAYISPTFFGDVSVVGGGERYALELARAVSSRIETTLVTFGRSGRLEIRHEGNLEVRKYPAGHFVKGNLANPLAFQFLRDLGIFDALHCYGFPKALTDLCMLYAKIVRKPIFVTDVHGGGVCVSSYLGKLGLDTRRFVDRFLLLSAHNASRYSNHASRVRVVGGGVDVKHFQADESRREHRVLFVGRLLPVKGIDYLIDAVDHRTPLRIVGRPYDDAYYGELRLRAAGKLVEFRTDVGETELVLEYGSAQVTVVPSVYTDARGNSTSGELFGLVALESMACGTPVIASRCGGLPEVVEDGVTGFVVPPNDSRALAERIRFLLERPEVARAMGEAGRNRVLRDFTWDRVASRCLDAYREVVPSS
jgi:glycosyltransferase involved in cell wall biosynthesis